MKLYKHASFWLLVLAIALILYQVRLLSATEQYVGLQDLDLMSKEVNELKNNVVQSQKSLDNLKQQLDTIMNGNVEDELARHLRGEIERFKMQAGLTDVTGEGIIVIIDDGRRDLMEAETPNDLVVHDLDLRTIVDDLRIAGAEAISVNGTRIVTGQTEIVCNGPTIRINGVQQAQPYIIRAIGDRYKLEAKLTDTESYAHALKQLGLKMEVNTRINISINKLSKQADFEYAKSLE